MKRISFLMLGAFILILPAFAQGGDEIVNIPDTAFLYALIDFGVDTNEDSLISFSEAESVTELWAIGWGITDLTGIEAFVMLDTLVLQDNNIETANLSILSELTFLIMSLNPLDSLDISNSTGLKLLVLYHCSLTSLDLSNHPMLEVLGVLNNQIRSLDFSTNVNLWGLDCRQNNLERLDVSNNLKLKELYCGGNSLDTLDLTKNDSLEVLWCDNNGLTSLILPDSSAMKELSLVGNSLESVDVTSCPYLEFFQPANNKFTSLDLSNNTLLSWLSCEINQLTELDVSNNPELNMLWCGDNLLTTLDLTSNNKLGSISTTFGNLNVDNMPTLGEVCVWDGFPGDAEISYEGSPNVCFESGEACDGCCGDCSSGIEEFNDSELMIYPNPTFDMLTIETTISGPHSIQLHSLNGQEIYATTFTGSLHEIDLSSFRRGIYILNIRSGNLTTTRKVVKL